METVPKTWRSGVTSSVFPPVPEVILLGECPPRTAWTRVQSFQSARASLPRRRSMPRRVSTPALAGSSTGFARSVTSAVQPVRARHTGPSALSWYVSGVLAVLLVGVLWVRHGASTSTPAKLQTPAATLRAEAPQLILDAASLRGVVASR